MRPVELRMHGFAAFREPTTVDFTGVEYFALVGPTGSGKSTVIDAMTFALYGSVPRWDDRRTVSLALSPTANRGTVRLVFDLGTDRYVVARELRRAANGSVTVRNATLERLLGSSDPVPEAGLDLAVGPEAGEVVPDPLAGVETEVLAADSLPVSKAVEELLGLPFEQFCICVVLPQGDFAQFLHAKPADRQKTLTRILGLGMYEVMAREAAGEAKLQGQRADLLAEQLGGYADASEVAAAEAADREAQLAALVDRVGVAVPELAARDAEVREAELAAGRLRDERDQLAGLRGPAGLDELAGRARAAERAVAGARRDLVAAEAADTGARERLAAAPDREPLRQLRRDHAELATLLAGLPELTAERDRARVRTAEASGAAAGAAAGLDVPRAERDRLAGELTGLRTEAERLAGERALLAGLRVPDGVAELDKQRRTSAEQLSMARRELTEAEAADRAARAALAGGPDRFRLAQARREHVELRDAEGSRRAGEQRRREAAERARTAGARLADTERALAEAEAARAAATRADLVGALRPGLALHENCPVCEQRVATLPPPVAAADLTAAERAVAVATDRRTEAATGQRAATEAEHRAAAELDALATRIGALRAALADAPGGLEQVDTLLARADELAATSARAEQRAQRAREERDRADTEGTDVARRLAGAAADLRTARDPLVALGAPAVEAPEAGTEPATGPDRDADLATAWRRLADWARDGAQRRDGELTDTRAALAGAQRAHADAERALAEAAERAQRLRGAETQAVRAEQDAQGALTGGQGRAEQLEVALAGQPADDELARRLAELDELAAQVRAADAALRTARAEVTAAQRTAEQVAAAVEHGWRALRAARDPLVGLGAPAPDGPSRTGDDLVGAWSALTEWARVAAAERAERHTTAEATVAGTRDRRGEAHRALAADLAAHGVPVPTEPPAAPITERATARPTPARPAGRSLASAAEAAASTELERARGARARIAERRAEAAKLAADRAEADDAARVARMLAGLLRSDAFPRWLVASALDALVADASRSLAELSGGQFELAHADGEFLVLDHADADSLRPVKTLSGGETFQASLALALALSEQLASLASAGAVRLDSIFLDEGFGTLDEANLEIVAGTLENLASLGDRMVGVITHVPALAERVPVRFAVSRDQRTSSIMREDLA
ncbi:MAG TPA: SMC family ATPase [Pseudonocardia sp.]|jgi:exonuclease SbcC|nr:SMC family ATPase [Pseudonocardia sp.]